MKADTSKSTMLIISMGLLLFYILFYWEWAIFISFIVGVIGIFSSYLSRKIEWAWMKFAKIFELIVPNVLLSIVFYLLLFPLSILTKLISKDPLMLSNEYSTYFIDIKKEIDKTSFKKLW